MTPDQIQALTRLRPHIVNVVGFYDLLYDAGINPGPLARMKHEIHFATSARALAIELSKLIDDITDEGPGRA